MKRSIFRILFAPIAILGVAIIALSTTGCYSDIEKDFIPSWAIGRWVPIDGKTPGEWRITSTAVQTASLKAYVNEMESIEATDAALSFSYVMPDTFIKAGWADYLDQTGTYGVWTFTLVPDPIPVQGSGAQMTGMIIESIGMDTLVYQVKRVQ